MIGLSWDRGELVEVVRHVLLDEGVMGDLAGVSDKIVDVIEGVLVCRHSERIRAGLRAGGRSRLRHGRPRAFSDSDRAALAAEAAAGKTHAELALEWGVSPWTIAKYLRTVA